MKVESFRYILSEAKVVRWVKFRYYLSKSMLKPIIVVMFTVSYLLKFILVKYALECDRYLRWQARVTPADT